MSCSPLCDPCTQIALRITEKMKAFCQFCRKQGSMIRKGAPGIWFSKRNPPLGPVWFAESLISPFAKGDFGLSAHFELTRGGFCLVECCYVYVFDCLRRVPFGIIKVSIVVFGLDESFAVAPKGTPQIRCARRGRQKGRQTLPPWRDFPGFCQASAQLS